MQMRRQRRPLETKESKTVSVATRSGVDSQLFEKLRAHRSQLAHQRAIPPYIIFHDKTLHEMAQQRPRNENDLRAITGVGEKKLIEYGAGFLHIVEEFVTSLNVPES